MGMFCYQCEQTAKGVGCCIMGVCGKEENVANGQDELIKNLKIFCYYYDKIRGEGQRRVEYDRFVCDVLFTTITNVNFDESDIQKINEKLKKYIKEIKVLSSYDNLDGREEKAQRINVSSSIPLRIKEKGEDIVALQELLTYGLKGMGAYAHHAYVLGVEDESIYGFFVKTMAKLTLEEISVEELILLNLECGKINLKVMELLHKANTGVYGSPEPTNVRITPLKGKSILVSGHDLKDLEELLKQTMGLGINVYTHGEMLPALSYPKLKKYPHLVGNYGGAWQDQNKEFNVFKGAILMTTNCIQNPKGYEDRIFTSGLVSYPDVVHVDNRDFSKVIEKALSVEGFEFDGEDKTITIGFGLDAIMGVADTVIEYVKSGKIRHMFLVGGCDGAKSGRNYYTDFALKVPKDCVILTLACGKYRFNKLDFGEIEGIPRLLDMGQCNDAYSAIKVAVALSEAFKCDVNSLPLSIILSWYEQKAVCVLLTLLHLGIKNIKLGPSLPAFITPKILEILVKNFNISLIDTVEKDMKECLNRK